MTMLKQVAISALLLSVTSFSPVQAEEAEIVERAVHVKNGLFSPEIIKVPAGKRIRIVVTNDGPGPEEFESSVLGVESVMNAGVTRKVIIAPLKQGEYPFIGKFHMDTAKGKIIAK